MKLPLGGDQVPGDDSRLPTDAAYDAIASTLARGAARWPVERDRGQRFIQVGLAVVDRMRAMRRPGESYRDVAKEPIYVRRPFKGSLPSSAL